MPGFRFNFTVDSEDCAPGAESQEMNSSLETTVPEIEQEVPAAQPAVQLSQERLERLCGSAVDELVPVAGYAVQCNGTRLYQRAPTDVEVACMQLDTLDNTGQETESPAEVVRLLRQRADVVHGEYEGGFKTWEGAHDLAAMVAEMYGANDGSLRGKRVLELGCGAALPGLVCAAPRLEAKAVVFQDYNESVLAWLTVPNVHLNTTHLPEVGVDNWFDNAQIPAAQLPDNRLTFVSGPWAALPALPLTGSGDFDLVLTAETVYHAPYHASLLEAIVAALAPSGVALLAAKTHYFGCSGALRDFLALVDRDGRLVWENVYAVKDTVRREIVRLQWAPRAGGP